MEIKKLYTEPQVDMLEVKIEHACMSYGANGMENGNPVSGSSYDWE